MPIILTSNILPIDGQVDLFLQKVEIPSGLSSAWHLGLQGLCLDWGQLLLLTVVRGIPTEAHAGTLDESMELRTSSN